MPRPLIHRTRRPLPSLLLSALLLACLPLGCTEAPLPDVDAHAGHDHGPGEHGVDTGGHAPHAGALHGTLELGSGLAEQLAPRLLELLAQGPPPDRSAQWAERMTAELEASADAAPLFYDSVFVIGRRTPDGPPALVTKVPMTPLPMQFELDARDMLSVGSMSGNWHLTARLDSDGDATALRGDVEGRAQVQMTPQGASVTVVLDRILTESDAPVVLDGPGGHGDTGALAGHSASVGHSMPVGHGGAPALPPGPAPLPAGHPPIDGHPGLPADAGDDDGADSDQKLDGPRVRGTIELAPEFAQLNGTRKLFLMLKAKTGLKMPIAVVMVDAPRFPLDFDIGPEHVTLQVENKPDMLQGELLLTARLDTDGMPLSKQAGDVECEPALITADSEPMTITLDIRRAQ